MRALADIDVVGVVGAGTMGNGIAQVAATAGYEVAMRDIEPEYVERGSTASTTASPGSTRRGGSTTPRKRSGTE